jgi:hypothetical protein
LYFGVADTSNDGVIEGLDSGSFIGAIFIIELTLAELAVYLTDMDLTDWGTDVLPVRPSLVYLIAFCGASFFGDIVFYTLSFFYLIMAGAATATVTGFSLLTVSFGF